MLCVCACPVRDRTCDSLDNPSHKNVFAIPMCLCVAWSIADRHANAVCVILVRVEHEPNSLPLTGWYFCHTNYEILLLCVVQQFPQSRTGWFLFGIRVVQTSNSRTGLHSCGILANGADFIVAQFGVIWVPIFVNIPMQKLPGLQRTKKLRSVIAILFGLWGLFTYGRNVPLGWRSHSSFLMVLIGTNSGVVHHPDEGLWFNRATLRDDRFHFA